MKYDINEAKKNKLDPQVLAQMKRLKKEKKELDNLMGL